MATAKLLRTSSRPLQLPSSISSSFIKCVRHCYQSRASLSGYRIIASGKGEREQVVAVKASMGTANHITTSQLVVRDREGLSNLAAIISSIRNAMLVLLRAALNRKTWINLQPQMLIERVLL